MCCAHGSDDVYTAFADDRSSQQADSRHGYVGDLFEDFYDTIDVSLERFRTDFTGSWMFAYIAALRPQA